MPRLSPLWFALGLALAPIAWAADAPPPAGPAKAITSPTLHNFFQVADGLYSGSSPDDAAAFAELAKLGIKTIVTVDGAKPNVALAHQFGLKYVHLPIGYDGVPESRRVELAKAIQEAGSPVYIHCHHGKHRGPAAAAAVCVATKGWTVARAEEFLKQAGTAADYAGLYRDVRDCRVPTPEQLAKAPAQFPEIAKTPPLVDVMVSIDERFDALKDFQKAGWKSEPGKRAAKETATLLWEHFKELQRDPSAEQHGPDYRQQLDGAVRTADTLRATLSDTLLANDLRDQAMKMAMESCTACHKAHRN